ncbi:MAG: NAD(P)/FAD-dependent oxidoreductase [Candidatus Methanoliparum thermophilum]|uniref:NAD(P)/FAD-dependent oxidoreductase n=1 Tax=Methanoliparum thermophilum TaxID=2491083 RepID=A0A520KRU0_METT2|nr:MAG: NAD(P)/FAD-dependent oxidoreductase [Candidatus Methanoliparum thermophilum]
MKKIKCDVVVVGAGPGGSMAAKTCAKYGLDTVLVERKEYPARPEINFCMVHRRLLDYIKIDKKIIESPIRGLVSYSPDGRKISTYEPPGYEFGYQVNRKTFDRELLKLPLKAGAEVLTKTRATGLIREDGRIKGIKAKIEEKEEVEIRSNIVIGADGVQSKVGRWAGIYDKGLNLNDSLLVIESVLDDVNMDEEERLTYFEWFGYKHLPDIVFASGPKGDGKVVLDTMRFKRPHYPTKKGEFFDAERYFIKNHPFFSRSKIVERSGGVIPFNQFKKHITDGVMLVGVTAHHNNPIRQDGLIQAMENGVLSGEVAVEAHEEGDFSSEFLSRYDKRWYRLYGEKYFLNYYIVRFYDYLPNKDINRFFSLLEDNNYTFTDEIFKEASKSPKIISKFINGLKNEGWGINDMFSLVSLLKKYHRNFWDTFL